jgi:hypothetical protein
MRYHINPLDNDFEAICKIASIIPRYPSRVGRVAYGNSALVALRLDWKMGSVPGTQPLFRASEQWCLRLAPLVG